MPTAEIQPYGALTFPFDEGTKEKIKKLGAQWNHPGAPKAWLVSADRLAVARIILEQAARERGWKLLDYSSKTAEKIKTEQAQERRRELAAHQAAFIDALKLIPPRTHAGMHTMPPGVSLR